MFGERTIMANNYLPTEFIYYVYKHIDPRNDELIYIGHGCRGRAWIHGSKKTCLRSQAHLNHLDSMTQDGFIPSDWVSIVVQGVSKKDACALEQELIRELNPTYNKPQGRHLLKLSPEQYDICQNLRDEGWFYHQIATEVGVSTMTVYRALNNQTKNIGDDYAG
jgi:hypothetical protein